jgi:hypothetical protein
MGKQIILLPLMATIIIGCGGGSGGASTTTNIPANNNQTTTPPVDTTTPPVDTTTLNTPNIDFLNKTISTPSSNKSINIYETNLPTPPSL